MRGPGDHVLAWAAQAVAPGARIAALNQMEDGTQRPDADAYGWITALRAPASAS